MVGMGESPPGSAGVMHLSGKQSPSRTSPSPASLNSAFPSLGTVMKEAEFLSSVKPPSFRIRSTLPDRAMSWLPRQA